MEIFLKQIITLMTLWILKMINGIFEIIDNIFDLKIINDDNENINIINYLLQDNKVSLIFWIVFIITIVLCLIFAIISLIKNMIKNNKTIGSIIGQFILSIISTFVVLMIFYIFTMISNSFFKFLFTIFNNKLEINVSKIILDLSINEWFNNYSINEIDISKITVGQLLGEYEYKSYLIFPNNWKYNGMINPDTYLYLPSFIVSLIILGCLIYIIITLIKRIYNIILLYMVMPLTLSTISLDDGMRFKIWLEEFIKTLLISYVLLLLINIFNVSILLINRLVIDHTISNYSQSLIKMFFITGGVVFITSGINLFTRIITSHNKISISKILKIKRTIYGGNE